MKQETKDNGESRNVASALELIEMILRGQEDRLPGVGGEAMTHDSEAVRATAEASFKKPEPQGDAARSEREAVEHQRLREARLTKEARERLGAEIRASRRSGT